MPPKIVDPLDVTEAAELLGCSVITVRRLVRANSLRHAYRIPGSPTSGLLISRESVLSYRDVRDANATAVAAGKPNPDYVDVLEALRQSADQFEKEGGPDHPLAVTYRRLGQAYEAILRAEAAYEAKQQKEKPDNEPAPEPKRKRKT